MTISEKVERSILRLKAQPNADKSYIKGAVNMAKVLLEQDPETVNEYMDKTEKRLKAQPNTDPAYIKGAVNMIKRFKEMLEEDK